MIEIKKKSDFWATSGLEATALTIAGSDPSGGAGLQADLKTFQQLGVFGMSAVTLLTVQNTLGVSRVELIAPELVAQQIDAVLGDISPKVIKLGALGSNEVVQLLAGKLRDVNIPLVIDPVMVSKHGHSLVANDFIASFKTGLLPLATMVTPNRHEAEKLVGFSINSSQDAGRAVRIMVEEFGCWTLLKLGRQADEYVHILGGNNGVQEIRHPYLCSQNTHGSGCVLSALIAGQIALGESEMPIIVHHAVNQVHAAIGIPNSFGGGIHPVETRRLQAPRPQ